METRSLGRYVRPVLALVVAPLILIYIVATSPGFLGLGMYGAVFFVCALWNFWALFRATGNRWTSLDGLFKPSHLAMVLGFLFVFIVWGPYVLNLWWTSRSVFALAYGMAALLTVLLLWYQPDTRRLRNYLLVVYNVMGTLALSAWAAADGGFDGGSLLSATAQSWGIMQTFLFIWGAFFGPIFFLPPLLVIEPRWSVEEEEEEDSDVMVDPETGVVTVGPVQQQEGMVPVLATAAGEAVIGGEPSARRPSRRKRGPIRSVASLGIDAALGAMVVLLLVFSVVGAVNIASWGTLPDPDDAEYGSSPDFEFTAMGRAFTDRTTSVDDWADVVDKEIEHALDLGLEHLRYDLQKEFIDEPREMAKLDLAVVDIRAAGLDLMFAPFGSAQWEADPPTFDEYVMEIDRETLLLVERYDPAWILPYFEPNGQAAVNLGKKMPVDVWVPVIDSIGERVHGMSDHTRVLIEIAIEPEQGTDLVEALSVPGLHIDAIGVDLYPLSAETLDSIDEYREHATNPDLGFWISEFGVGSVMSGQEGQARALSSLVSRATGHLNASGLCVWALLDDTVIPSNLGLVGRDGTPKEAYRVLKDAIEEVHGD